MVSWRKIDHAWYSTHPVDWPEYCRQVCRKCFVKARIFADRLYLKEQLFDNIRCQGGHWTSATLWPTAQDLFDVLLGGWAYPHDLLLETFVIPILLLPVAFMCFEHVFSKGGIFVLLVVALVECDPLMLMVNSSQICVYNYLGAVYICGDKQSLLHTLYGSYSMGHRPWLSSTGCCCAMPKFWSFR